MKAIETTYRGVLFRSKLEAQWAEFFDVISVAWDYEPEGYTDGKIRYLPDFWLPFVRSRGELGGVFFEVKPFSPLAPAVNKAEMLAFGSKKPVIVVTGMPRQGGVETLDEYKVRNNILTFDQYLQFACCDACGAADIGFYSSDEPRCQCGRGTFNPGHSKLEHARIAFPHYGRWKAAAA